jgi:hypothetical protein
MASWAARHRLSSDQRGDPASGRVKRNPHDLQATAKWAE